MHLVRRLLRLRLVAELARFGVVGMICLVADVVLFNLFAFGFGMPPVLAKSVGLVITAVMAFFGHRTITFRDRHGGGYGREVATFLLATTVTVLMSLAPLYVARHMLGITSVVGLNVANVIGIALGTAARYLAYRYMVWVKPVVLPEPVPVSGGRVPLAGHGPLHHESGGRRLLEVQDELVRE